MRWTALPYDEGDSQGEENYILAQNKLWVITGKSRTARSDRLF